jgi:hypothetical protein
MSLSVAGWYSSEWQGDLWIGKALKRISLALIRVQSLHLQDSQCPSWDSNTINRPVEGRTWNIVCEHTYRSAINTLDTDEPARLWFHNVMNGWWAGLYLALVRFESATHCIVLPQLVWSAWVKSLSCLFMDIRYVIPLLSGLRLKKGPFVLFHSQAVYMSQESDMQLVFRNVSRGGSYYWAQKHIREDLILPELLSDSLFHVPYDIFQWKWRFCERNKNCATRRKNTVKVKQAQGKWQYFKNVGATIWVNEDKMPNLGPSTGNPGVKQIPSHPTKVWWIIELFSKTTSLRCYARRLTCIIFKIKANMIAVLRCWNG